MAGLDNVTPATDTSDESVNLGGKGAKAVVANESVLANMERLYQQKQAQNQGFLGSIMEGLKDAAAWTSGGMHGPSEALALRAAEKDKQAKELFDMQTQIAAQKAALQGQRDFRALLTGGEGAAGVPGAPGASGVGTIQNAINNMSPEMKQSLALMATKNPEKANSELFSYLSKQAETSEMTKDYNGLIRMGYPEPTARQMALTKHLGSTLTPQVFAGPDGDVRSTVFQQAPNILSGIINPGATAQNPSMAGARTPAERAIVATESGGNPNVVSPAGATGAWQVMPNTKTDPGFGVTPAQNNSPAELDRVGKDYYNAMVSRYQDPALAAIAYNMGPGATDQWIKGGAKWEALPTETKNYVGKVATLTALNQKAPAAQPSSGAPVATPIAPQVTLPGTNLAAPEIAPKPQVGAPAPTTQVPTIPGVSPTSVQGLEHRKDIAKKIADTNIELQKAQPEKEAETIGKSAGDREAAMIKAAEAAEGVIRNADLIYEAADKMPHIFNVSATLPHSIRSAFAKTLLLKDKEDAEKFASTHMLTPKELSRQELVDKAANQMAIEYASEAFKGSRLGVGMENLALKSKGVGTNLTAETNKYNSIAMKEVAEFSKVVRDLYTQYKTTHPSASFDDFQRSKEYMAAENVPLKKLHSVFPQYFPEPKEGKERVTKSGLKYTVE